MRFNPTARRIYLAPALGLVLVTAMSACSSSASSSSSTPAASASDVTSTAASASASASAAVTASGSSSAVSEITTDWNAFFSSATSNARRVQLLQNGSDFASAIQDFASSPLAALVTSKVDDVTLTSSTAAKVKYDLSASGTKVANGATGTSVLQGGTWKVGDDVFCGLLTEAKGFGLSVTVPPVCNSAS